MQGNGSDNSEQNTLLMKSKFVSPVYGILGKNLNGKQISSIDGQTE